VGTSDMPIPAWRRTFRLVHMASAAYNLRLLRVVLQYLASIEADRAAYLTELCDSMRHAGRGTVLAEIANLFDRYLASILDDGPLTLPLDLTGDGPLPVEDAVSATVLARPAAFYAEARGFTERFLARAGHDTAQVEEVFRYQELITPRFGEPGPAAMDLAHDLPSFAASGTDDPPIARPRRVRFLPPAYVTVPDFAVFVRTHLACLRAHLSTGEIVVDESALHVA
jgi:hypothetical protein